MYQGYVLNGSESRKYELLEAASSATDQKWETPTHAYTAVDQTGKNARATSKWSLGKRVIAKCRNLDKLVRRALLNMSWKLTSRAMFYSPIPYIPIPLSKNKHKNLCEKCGHTLALLV